MRTFNIYCDENCHLKNEQHSFMLLGYTRVPYNQKNLHLENLKVIKNAYHYFGEIKWNKVSSSNYNFYAELIDYFFATDLAFRALVIEKAEFDNNVIDIEEFHYKMYYQLILHKLDFKDNYNIYIDYNDTRSIVKIRNLRSILQSKYGVIRNLQSIHSKESLFIQLADFIMGGISYYLHGLNKVEAKNKLITKIIKNSHNNLKFLVDENDSKVNFIELGNING